MRSVFGGEANTFNIIISVEHSVHRGAHLGSKCWTHYDIKERIV